MTKQEAVDELTNYVLRSNISSYVHTDREDAAALAAIEVLASESEVNG